MTWFGKILVMINVAVSLLLMSLAIILFLNRVDWSDQKGKDGKPDGELVRRQALVTDLWNNIPPPEYLWRTTRDNLVVMEEGTPAKQYKDGWLAHRAWYEAEIQHLLTGATANNPARAVVFDTTANNRRYIADDQNFGRPKMAAATDRSGAPLKSLAAYEQEERIAFAAVQKEQERLKAATEEDTKLTELLLGPKGLQQRLVDAQATRAGILVQHDEVKRPLINTQVELELLLRRMRELEYRLEELKKAKAARVAGTGRSLP